MRLRSQNKKTGRMSTGGARSKQTQGSVPAGTGLEANNNLGAVGGEIGAGEERANFSLTREELSALQNMSEGEIDKDADLGDIGQMLTDTRIEMMDRARAELNRFKNDMHKQIMNMVARSMPTPPTRDFPRLSTQQAEEPTRQSRPERLFERDERNRYSFDDSHGDLRLNNSNQRYGSHESRETPVHKWGISFEGVDSTVTIDDFIFRVEHLQRYHNIPWNTVVGQFHKLLKGKAADWYWTHIKMNMVQDWPTLRIAMFKAFSSPLSNFDLERQLMERRQRQNEPIDEYIHEMSNLRSRLRRHIPESDMVRILKRNVLENVGKILYPMFIRSVEQFRTEYHLIQNTFNYKPQIRTPPNHNQNRNYYQVNEINPYEDTPQSDETLPFAFQQPTTGASRMPLSYPGIAEIPPPMPRQLVCWNCKVAGHTYFDCEQPRNIFCYKCGLPDTITPKCIRCQENSNRGSYQARATNSKQNQMN